MYQSKKYEKYSKISQNSNKKFQLFSEFQIVIVHRKYKKFLHIYLPELKLKFLPKLKINFCMEKWHETPFWFILRLYSSI